MKETFVLYTSMLKSTKKLSLEQKGKLFEAIIEYQMTGEVPEIDDLAVEIYFDMIKNQMDLDNKKYQETLEKRREAGRKGGKAKKANDKNNNDDEAKEANAKFAKQMEAKKANDKNNNDDEAKEANAKFAKQMEAKKANGFFEKHNDNDNDNVNDNNISCQSQSDFQTYFEVWNDYAEKFGLPKVEKLNDKRKRKLKTREKENPSFLVDFEKALREVENSSFLRGENRNNWKITFDWLIENDTNYLKVIEGQYQDKEMSPYEEQITCGL